MKTKEYFIDLSNQPMAYHINVDGEGGRGCYFHNITSVEATSDGAVYVVLQESDIPEVVYDCLCDMIANGIDAGHYDDDEFIEPDGVEL